MRIRSRLKYWWAMFGPVGKMVAGIYGLYGIFATIVSFLPVESREKLEGSALLKWAPAWSIWEWTGLALGVVLIAVIETSWRRHGRGAPKPELMLGHKGTLFHQLWVTNVGPPATFRAQLRIIDTNADRHAVGPQGPLHWETEQDINVRLATGASDWILLARRDLFTLFRYSATTKSTSVLLEEGPTSDKRPPYAVFEVAVISDPPFEDGPLIRRYFYDRGGIKVLPLTESGPLYGGGSLIEDAAPLSIAPSTLSSDEKEQIQKIRYAWRESGMYAANGLDSLLDQVLDSYARMNPVGGFLYHAQHQLRGARDAVEKALANDSVQSLDQVRKHLNVYTETYINAYALIQVIHENGMPISGETFKTIIEVWQGLHEKWQERLIELYHRPEHGDTLRTFRGVRPPAFFPLHMAAGALRVSATGSVTPPRAPDDPGSSS